MPFRLEVPKSMKKSFHVRLTSLREPSGPRAPLFRHFDTKGENYGLPKKETGLTGSTRNRDLKFPHFDPTRIVSETICDTSTPKNSTRWILEFSSFCGKSLSCGGTGVRKHRGVSGKNLVHSVPWTTIVRDSLKKGLWQLHSFPLCCISYSILLQ